MSPDADPVDPDAVHERAAAHDDDVRWRTEDYCTLLAATVHGYEENRRILQTWGASPTSGWTRDVRRATETNEQRRQDAIQELARLLPQLERPALAPYLTHASAAVRRAAQQALARIGPHCGPHQTEAE